MKLHTVVKRHCCTWEILELLQAQRCDTTSTTWTLKSEWVLQHTNCRTVFYSNLPDCLLVIKMLSDKILFYFVWEYDQEYDAAFKSSRSHMKACWESHSVRTCFMQTALLVELGPRGTVFIQTPWEGRVSSFHFSKTVLFAWTLFFKTGQGVCGLSIII